MTLGIAHRRCVVQKISGILPSSARINQVDQKSSPALRPGAPQFGQAELKTKAEPDVKSLTTAQKALGAHKQLMENRKATHKEAQLVQDMADQFFMNRARLPSPQNEEFQFENIENQLGLKNIASAPESPISQISGDRAVESDLTPPGSILDRWA